jgi:hypothetical protein
MQPRKNTHKKLPTGIKKAIIEAQRVGCSRIWRTASGTVHRTIKYPKTWPVPSVLIKKYPVQRQAIRNSDKAPDTHQIDFQKPLPAEIRLTEISVITEIKMKTTIRIIIYLTRQSSAAAIAGRAAKDNRRDLPPGPPAGQAQQTQLQFSISLTPEDRFAPVASAKHMLDCARIFDAQRSGHWVQRMKIISIGVNT